MTKPTITEKTFSFFNSLSTRQSTNRIILHHTGGADIDAYAEQIHQWHLNNGWAGIGYHFVIRKSGEIERGRPQWAIGSHAYGANNDSIGIHLSGEFTYNTPTDAQIESAAILIAYLCEEYQIPVDRAHILGHREVTPTDCPGNILFSMLGVIVNKARWRRYGGADVVDKPVDTPKIIFKPKAGMLSEHFSESEFACDCGKVEADPRLIELLEQLRYNCGGYPIPILDGFCCEEHFGNLSDIGDLSSIDDLSEFGEIYHAQGKAVDILCPKQLSWGEFKWYIERLPFDGICYFPNIQAVHLDVRNGGIGTKIFAEG